MLKPCRECAANVSTKAQYCPYCGVAKPIRRKARTVLRVVGGLLGLVVCISIVGTIYDVDQTEQRANASLKAAFPGYRRALDGVIIPTDCSLSARKNMSAADVQACKQHGTVDFTKPLLVPAGSWVCISSDELSLAEAGHPAHCITLPQTQPVTGLTSTFWTQHMQVRFGYNANNIIDGWVAKQDLANWQ